MAARLTNDSACNAVRASVAAAGPTAGAGTDDAIIHYLIHQPLWPFQGFEV